MQHPIIWMVLFYYQQLQVKVMIAVYLKHELFLLLFFIMATDFLYVFSKFQVVIELVEVIIITAIIVIVTIIVTIAITIIIVATTTVITIIITTILITFFFILLILFIITIIIVILVDLLTIFSLHFSFSILPLFLISSNLILL